MVTEVAPRLLIWASDIEQDTILQAARAARLPFVEGHVALMPDAHVGKGATVGSVIPTRGAIIPAAVGVDIGCGMVAVETDLTASDLPNNLGILMPLIGLAWDNPRLCLHLSLWAGVGIRGDPRSRLAPDPPGSGDSLSP